MVPPPSAALPTGILFASLGSLLGPLTVLAVVATIVALVVVVAGVLLEHREVGALCRPPHEGPVAAGASAAPRSAA